MTVSTVLVARLHAAVGERLDEREARDEADGRRPLGTDDRRQLARQLLTQQLAQLDGERMATGEAPITSQDARQLATAVLNRLFGLGRLQDYIDDPQWTDIHANGCDEVWLTHRDGFAQRGEPIADSDNELIELAKCRVGLLYFGLLRRGATALRSH